MHALGSERFFYPLRLGVVDDEWMHCYYRIRPQLTINYLYCFPIDVTVNACYASLAKGVARSSGRHAHIGYSKKNLKNTHENSLPLASLHLLSSPHRPLLPLPPCTHSPRSLRSRSPLFQLGCLGSAVSFPSKVWGKAPAEIDFGTF